MSRTDDDAAARTRLERIAWGAGSTPAEAARARIALADLDREARRDSAPPVPPHGRRGREDAGTTTGRRGPDSRVDSPSPAAAPAAARTAPPGVVPPEAGVRVLPPSPAATRTAAPATPVAIPPVAAGPATDGRTLDGRAGRDHARADADDGRADRDDGRAVDGGDPVPDRAVDDGAEPGLLAGVRRLGRRVRRTDRTVLWGLGAAAVVVGLVAGVGVGLSVGTRSTQPATAAVTPAVGTVTLQQMLDMPQTYADELPGSVEAPVALRTTRLVFTNRSLSGASGATPWNVWAGVGRDGSSICLVASADRIEGSSACYPREDALHGTVSLTATSLSGTLWVRLVGGAVRGTVTSAAPASMY